MICRVLSTLKSVEKQAGLLNMETTCVTFDQPLYIKAVEIAHAADLDVVCRLRGFHLLMNFMGATGAIMTADTTVIYTISNVYRWHIYGTAEYVFSNIIGTERLRNRYTAL